MDPLITHLCDRARKNDPRLRHVSLRSLPLLEVTNEEMYAVVESLECNTHVSTFDMSIHYEEDDADAEADAPGERQNINETEHVPLIPSQAPPPPFELVLSRNTSLLDVRISSSSSLILASVFRGLARNSSVKILQVGEMSATGETVDMSSDCALELKYMLECNHTIDRLALQGLQWREPRALKWVSSGLRANRALQFLELMQIVTTSAESATVQHSGDHLMSAISAMKNLKRLSIISCEMSDISFADADGSTPGPNMEVDIPLITSIPKASPTSSEMRSNRTQLEELRLVDCELTGPAICSLQRGWQNNPFLKVLDVRGNSLDDESCYAIADILRIARSLTKVILEDNNIGDRGISILARKGLCGSKKLRKLSLKENNFGPSGVQILANELQYDQHLQELDLSYNTIGEDGAVALGDMLLKNRALQELVLESGSIGGLGVVGLRNGLRPNTSLRKLNLSANIFGDMGFQALGDLLMEGEEAQCPLKSLRLSSCQLGDAGVTVLALALEHNHTLEEIVLPFNRFGDEGAAAIGQSLPNWKGLASLQIQFNLFSDSGFEQIVRGLSKNFCLKSMYLLNAGPSNRRVNDLFQEMQHWIRLNKGGRRVLNEPPIFAALWPAVLAKAHRAYGAEAVYHLLSQRPDCVGV